MKGPEFVIVYGPMESGKTLKWISPVRGWRPSASDLIRYVPKTGCGLIAAERDRQIKSKGFTPEHDNAHRRGQLIDAGLSYIHAAINSGHPAVRHPAAAWPWESEWWKPSDDPIRNLTKAGALIAAEIDRLIQIRIKEFAPADYVIKAMPEIVCLCGSTRFWKQFQKSSLELTMAGKIVLSIGAASGTDDEHFGNLPREEYDAIKQRLDELHKRKIDLADSVLILNVDGYIGESTRSELEYARGKGKRVAFLEPIGGVVRE